jgi:hypothetical protein
MALSGNLRDFSIPDVFRLISLSGKTGVLHLLTPGSEGSVWFRGGQVFFAQSDRRRGLLGERLVSAGRISASALQAALDTRAEEPEGGRRIGEILVDNGAIDLEVLQSFVQEQIQDTVFDLFLWEEGSFDFEMLAAPPEDQDIGLTVSIENIVMEGARRLDEWTKLRTSAAAGNVIFRVGSVSGEHVVDIALKPSEWRVVTLTDGTRTVRQVAEAAGVPENQASRTLYGLFGAGLLQIVDPAEHFGAAPAFEPEPVPAISPQEPLVLDSGTVLAFEPELAEPAEPEADPEPEPEPESVPEPEPELELELAREPQPEPEPEPELEPVREQEPEPEPEREPAPAAEPPPAWHVEPIDLAADEPAIREYDRDDDLEQSMPPVGLVYGLARGTTDEPATAEAFTESRGAWAGIGNEVAALTGAQTRPAKYAPPRTAGRTLDLSVRRIRWDSTITRDDLERIHAGIKEL